MNPIQLDNRKVDRILVVDTARLGDIVTMEPALRVLQQNFPEASIDAACIPVSGEVLADQPTVDRVIEWDKRGEDSGVFGLFRVMKRLDADYDLAVLFHNSIGSALLPFFRRIPLRAGYATELRSPLLTHAVPEPATELHLIDSRLHLLEELGLDTSDVTREPSLALNRDKAEDWLAQHMPADWKKRETVLIPVSAGYETKTWPARNIHDFINLFPVNSINAVITGAPGDREKAEEIYSYNNPMVDLVGKTSVRELMQAISASDLVVSPDTGPMHLAAALEVPVIALFGPTDPELCGAVGDDVTVLQADLKCVRCYKKSCNFNPFCMRDSLTPEMVFFHAARKLGLDPMEVMDSQDGSQHVLREAGAV